MEICRFEYKSGITKREARQHFRTILVLLAAAVFMMAAGCKSPSTRVSEHFDQLREQWQTNILYQANLPERTLDWHNAVAIMLDNNLKLLQARTEYTNAQESVRQVYKDLIPTLNLRSGVSKNITSLDRITADDVTFSADSFFSIPGVVNFGSRLYAAKLYEMRAEAAYKLSEREQIIELYRLFYTAQEITVERERLENSRVTAEAMQEVDPFTAELMVTEMRTRELANASEIKNLQDRASELLGTREFQWFFATNGLPDLHYHQDPLPLTDTNRVAQLQMRLLAVELEAARAQLQGLKLRYWPELNIFLTGPPIYQRSGGDDRFWDADNLRVSADLFWQLDTRGHIRRIIKQTTRQQELQKERYRQESLTLMNRLLFTQQIVDSVEQHLERVNLQLEMLQALPMPRDILAIQRYLYDYRTLSQEQLRLRRELSELNALFWFVDEYAWDNQMSAAPAKTS